MPLRALLPAQLLRLEAFIELLLVVALYADVFPHHWGFFALLFLFPDIALLVYAAGPTKFATVLYNLLHTYALPMLLLMLAWHQGLLPVVRFSLVWLAHIAFDRVLGFGLKYPGIFKPTHLQRVE